MNRDYIQNRNLSVSYKGTKVLTSQEVVEAMNYANTALKELSDTTMRFDINIFETLGMRNLSGFVGEVLVSSIDKITNHKLVKNLHQDGYPDLLLNITKEMQRML